MILIGAQCCRQNMLLCNGSCPWSLADQASWEMPSNTSPFISIVERTIVCVIINGRIPLLEQPRPSQRFFVVNFPNSVIKESVHIITNKLFVFWEINAGQQTANLIDNLINCSYVSHKIFGQGDRRQTLHLIDNVRRKFALCSDVWKGTHCIAFIQINYFITSVNYLLSLTWQTAAHTAARAGRLGIFNSGSCCSVAAAAGNDFPAADGSAMVVLRVGVVCVGIELFSWFGHGLQHNEVFSAEVVSTWTNDALVSNF